MEVFNVRGPIRCSMWPQCVSDHLQKWFGRSDNNPSQKPLHWIYICALMWFSATWLQSGSSCCVTPGLRNPPTDCQIVCKFCTWIMETGRCICGGKSCKQQLSRKKKNVCLPITMLFGLLETNPLQFILQLSSFGVKDRTNSGVDQTSRLRCPWKQESGFAVKGSLVGFVWGAKAKRTKLETKGRKWTDCTVGKRRQNNQHALWTDVERWRGGSANWNMTRPSLTQLFVVIHKHNKAAFSRTADPVWLAGCGRGRRSRVKNLGETSLNGWNNGLYDEFYLCRFRLHCLALICWAGQIAFQLRYIQGCFPGRLSSWKSCPEYKSPS